MGLEERMARGGWDNFSVGQRGQKENKQKKPQPSASRLTARFLSLRLWHEDTYRLFFFSRSDSEVFQTKTTSLKCPSLLFQPNPIVASRHRRSVVFYLFVKAARVLSFFFKQLEALNNEKKRSTELLFDD